MFWVVVAVVVVVGFALAWWSSGRAKGRAHNPDAAHGRTETEANATKQYRPGGPPPGFGGGGSGSF